MNIFVTFWQTLQKRIRILVIQTYYLVLVTNNIVLPTQPSSENQSKQHKYAQQHQEDCECISVHNSKNNGNIIVVTT